MRVGLFLDFDGVLTPKPVNMQIAALLGVEKDLIDLEKNSRAESCPAQTLATHSCLYLRKRVLLVISLMPIF
jgi:hypothetical protein